jgi:hypothetical protein
MTSGAWIFLLALGSPELPELVVLPPQPVDMKPDVATQLWKETTKQIAKEQKTLEISMTVHEEAQDALTGPARDQAWECQSKADCLADLGATLGADLLIAGTVDKESVTLMLVDVRARKKIFAARSSKKLAEEGWKRQSQAVIKGVIKAFSDWRKAPPPPAPAVVESDDGEIRIPQSELIDVKEVAVDGKAAEPNADGEVRWLGAPGRHVITAQRTDGARASREVDLPPKGVVDVDLEFIAPPPPTPPPPALVAPTPPPAEDEGRKEVTSEWWFWTSLGAAVALGGTTAVLLLGGAKGGPEIAGSVGSISGTY